jgi:hypothetical protein
MNERMKENLHTIPFGEREKDREEETVLAL